MNKFHIHIPIFCAPSSSVPTSSDHELRSNRYPKITTAIVITRRNQIVESESDKSESDKSTSDNDEEEDFSGSNYSDSIDDDDNDSMDNDDDEQQ